MIGSIRLTEVFFCLIFFALFRLGWLNLCVVGLGWVGLCLFELIEFKLGYVKLR